MVRAKIGPRLPGQPDLVPPINFRFSLRGKPCDDDALVSNETPGPYLVDVTCEIEPGNWYAFRFRGSLIKVFFSRSMIALHLRSFISREFLLPADRVVLTHLFESLAPQFSLASLVPREFDLVTDRYLPVSISLAGENRWVFLPAGSIVAHLTAFVQATFFGTPICQSPRDLIPKVDGKVVNWDDPIREGRAVDFAFGREWSPEPRRLTFEFLGQPRFGADFSVDASFEYIAAVLGQARGVLWDCIIIAAHRGKFVRDIPDVANVLFQVACPGMDVSWETEIGRAHV
jgi:hypothetical protein